MAATHAFLDIQVRHAYFSDQLCKYLKFVATPGCQRKMDNAGLMYHGRDNDISIVSDPSRWQALLLYAQDEDDPLVLQFKAYSTDANFYWYTQGANLPDGDIFYFSYLLGGQEQTGAWGSGESGVIPLQQGKEVTEQDLLAPSQLKEKGLIDSKDLVGPPSFIIDLTITEQALEALAAGITAPVFEVNFQVPKNIWKYYLMSPSLSKELSIVDLDEKIHFQFCGFETLSSGREALTFKTLTPLPLYERSPYQFQLRSTGENVNSVLIKRLPVATAGHRHRVVIDGKGIELSEIYINY